MRPLIVIITLLVPTFCFAQEVRKLSAADLAVQTKKWAGKKVQGTFSCFYADVDEFRCIANRARVDFTSLEPPEARKRLEDQCDTIERSNRKTCTVNIQFTYEESDIRQNGLFQMTVITAEDNKGVVVK